MEGGFRERKGGVQDGWWDLQQKEGSGCEEAVALIHIHFVGILMIRLSDFLLCSLEQGPSGRKKKERKKEKP